MRQVAADIRISAGYDIRALTDKAEGPVVWAGSGAEAMGLTGVAEPADLTRVFSGENLDDDKNDEPLSLLDQ